MKKSIIRLMTLIAVMIMVVSTLAVSVSAETMYVSGAETGRVYLRVGPGSADYYTLLSNGTAVNSIGWARGWDGGYNQVIANGQIGWITSRYLSYYAPYTSYSRYTPARVGGVNWGVYVWSDSWSGNYLGYALLGETVYVDWSNVANGRVYGHRSNGVYGWFTTTYLY